MAATGWRRTGVWPLLGGSLGLDGATQQLRRHTTSLSRSDRAFSARPSRHGRPCSARLLASGQCGTIDGYSAANLVETTGATACQPPATPLVQPSDALPCSLVAQQCRRGAEGRRWGRLTRLSCR